MVKISVEVLVKLWMRTSRLQRLLLAIVVVFALGVLYNLTWKTTEIVRPESLQIIPEVAPAFSDRKYVPVPPSQLDDMRANNIDLESHQPLPIISDQSDSVKQRREAIRAACRHAWRGYKRFAWGHDHLLPISKRFEDWFGLGLTIIDALDTLYIMELQDEFQEARNFIKDELNFNKNKDVNFFEASIRVLGGLLGTYTLTKDQLFLDKAKDIGDRLLPAFNSRSRVPFSDVNIGAGVAHGPNWAQDSTVSEVSSVQLEFRTLSRYIDDPKYEQKAFFVSEHIHSLTKPRNLVPMFISTDTGRFGSDQTITLGARADSYYEYLLKQWIQTGMKIDFLRDDYLAAMESVREHLVRRSVPSQLLFIGELKGKNFSPKMDHLVCYLPGTLAMGHFMGGLPKWHLELAENLLQTCVKMYTTTATGLSPEIVHFNLAKNGDHDIIIKSNDAHNLLRPETVESLWYMWYFTRNETYRRWAWDIFKAFDDYTKVTSGGYTSIGNVQNKMYTRPRDKMESFFLGETLKYLYLMFASIEDLEKYSPKKFVYNTEAHPLPIYDHQL
ncbi:endoplasmic reticulum mannosyl-oligosaccharide 1,2-alpha-mannosidase-like isoform X2 [Varroa destructor]|uniref:alpha-1,2-Mannosidase n=1 Tax=Varroa destructor TaxID=109461 RepID=A0A7M7JF86_VARDE|nr:endoplasmic reticulum mannosyl-oligosaccharide 1,2-alpha-mannosidase-like isoform X2 [Varroa destructor]